jgi:hypothetical protein
MPRSPAPFCGIRHKLRPDIEGIETCLLLKFLLLKIHRSQTPPDIEGIETPPRPPPPIQAARHKPPPDIEGGVQASVRCPYPAYPSRTMTPE